MDGASPFFPCARRIRLTPGTTVALYAIIGKRSEPALSVELSEFSLYL